VYANKQDIKGALSHEDISELLGLRDIKNRHYHIQSCSAVTGKGLAEGVELSLLEIDLLEIRRASAVWTLSLTFFPFLASVFLVCSFQRKNHGEQQC